MEASSAERVSLQKCPVLIQRKTQEGKTSSKLGFNAVLFDMEDASVWKVGLEQSGAPGW